MSKICFRFVENNVSTMTIYNFYVFSTCNKDTRPEAILAIHFYSTPPIKWCIKTLVAYSLYYDKDSIFRSTITFHIRCNFRTNRCLYNLCRKFTKHNLYSSFTPSFMPFLDYPSSTGIYIFS